MATSCNTCIHFNAGSGVCGAYGLPAEGARALPSLCGDAGADHVIRPGNLADRMDWLLIGAIAAFSLLAALVLAAPEIATKLQALFA